MSTQTDYSQPPRELPVYARYLMGLSQDASKEEILREWLNQVVPLLNIGPQATYDREAEQLMAGGLTGPAARRVFGTTKRGRFLAQSIEREHAARNRAAQYKPPFERMKH